jgi:predicted kinase
MSATLYLFVGFPGSGKTTVAQYICETTGAEHIWADRERHAMFPAPTHSREESRQLYGKLNTQTSQWLRGGKSVVFDTNFNFRKDRDNLRKIAHDSGAAVKLIWMTTDKALAKDRALHDHHAERNGYNTTMDETTFERIAGHLEPPTDDEQPVRLNGVDLQREQVLSVLGIT